MLLSVPVGTLWLSETTESVKVFLREHCGKLRGICCKMQHYCWYLPLFARRL